MTETNVNESSNPINLKNNNVQIETLKDGGEEINKKNPKVKETMTRTMVVRKKVDKFSLDDLGTIENAKKHRSANRPLHKIDEFTDNVNFCRCCNLPCKEKGIIEPFSCCENIDNFAECGLGIPLYFYFFRFVFFIVLMGVLVLSISMIIFNLNYTDGIIDVCDIYYKNISSARQLDYCEGFISNPKDNPSIYNKTKNEDINRYKRFKRWILRLSSDNIKKYRLLGEQLNPNFKNNDNINKVIINYSLLNFCYLITCFILNIFFIIFIRAQAQKARILNFSIRDYTVLISDAKKILYDYNERQRKISPGLYSGSTIEVENGKEFKAYVNEYIKGHLYDLEIYNINMCYDLGEYIDFRDDYELCKRKIFQVEHNPHNIGLNNDRGLLGDDRLYYHFYLLEYGIYWFYCCHDNGVPLQTLRKQKIDLEKDLDFLQENAIQYVTDKNFTGYMLISFNTIRDKELFLAEYPHHFIDMIFYWLKNIKYYVFCCCVNKDKRIKFNRAKQIDAFDPPEPEDIIWENFNFSARQRGMRTLLVFLACLGIIFISLCIVFGLTFLQDIHNDLNKEGNIIIKYLVSLAITVVISLINTILQLILEKFTLFEKQISRSNYILSLSIKISIFTFLNSAIVPFLSKYLVLLIMDENRGYQENNTYERFKEKNFLLIDDLFIYFIVNAIVTPILWSFNVPYILRYIQQKCIECGKNPDENHYMSQRDLNKLYEYPDMNLAYKYSYLVKTTAMCFFFMPIFPLGFIFSVIGFIFGYFLEKFNFTHLYKRPEMLDEIITQTYADYFIIILFIGGIGDYVFLHDVFDNRRWALINIIVFGVLIIIPYTKCINCNFVGIDKSAYLNKPLSEVYFTFYNDYQRQNPLTKRIGLLNYLLELKKKDYLSDYAYQIAQENIEQLNIMEIYYGISRGNIPLAHQSVIANANNASILSTGNIKKSILGRGALKSTIVRPEIEDNPEMKKKKKKFFESQIINMFGKGMAKKGLNGHNIGAINEVDENSDGQLVDAYNNPLGINMGLGPLPLTQSIYKDDQNNENNSNQNLNV